MAVAFSSMLELIISKVEAQLTIASQSCSLNNLILVNKISNTKNLVCQGDNQVSQKSPLVLKYKSNHYLIVAKHRLRCWLPRFLQKTRARKLMYPKRHLVLNQQQCYAI